MPAAADTAEITEAPPWAAELLRDVRALKRSIERIAQPVALLTIVQAAHRLGKTERAADEFTRRHFTDTRESWDRRPGVRRLVYSDEVEVFLREKLAGLRRFRRECGRG